LSAVHRPAPTNGEAAPDDDRPAPPPARPLPDPRLSAVGPPRDAAAEGGPQREGADPQLSEDGGVAVGGDGAAHPDDAAARAAGATGSLMAGRKVAAADAGGDVRRTRRRHRAAGPPRAAERRCARRAAPLPLPRRVLPARVTHRAALVRRRLRLRRRLRGADLPGVPDPLLRRRAARPRLDRRDPRRSPRLRPRPRLPGLEGHGPDRLPRPGVHAPLRAGRQPVGPHDRPRAARPQAAAAPRARRAGQRGAGGWLSAPGSRTGAPITPPRPRRLRVRTLRVTRPSREA